MTTGRASIGNDRIRVDVAPDDGGRVAQITVDDVALLVAYATGPSRRRSRGARIRWCRGQDAFATADSGSTVRSTSCR